MKKGLRESIKSMKINFILSLLCSIIFLLFGRCLVEAMGSNTQIQQDNFTLKVDNNLIDLQSDKASIKDILNDLEKKIEIKVMILDGVNDKTVTLSVNNISINSIHILFEKMDIENFAVVYDEHLSSKVIYVLPDGKNLNEIVKDKTKTILFSTHIINVDVAQLVADDYLPKYYPGNWVFFNSFILYDLEGIPAAHAIVFRDANSKITTVEDLNLTMNEIRVKRDQRLAHLLQIQEKTDLSENLKGDELSRLKQVVNKLKRALYQPDNFATVITGATETSRLLIRCYRGIPTFLAKKDDIEMKLSSQYPDKILHLGRVIYFNPLDIRYEVKEGDGNGIDKLGQQVFDDSYLISISEDKMELISVAAAREVQRKNIANKEKNLHGMSTENKRRLEESEIEKQQHNKNRWAQYRNKYRGHND